jgi:hypothetical protein
LFLDKLKLPTFGNIRCSYRIFGSHENIVARGDRIDHTGECDNLQLRGEKEKGKKEPMAKRIGQSDSSCSGAHTKPRGGSPPLGLTMVMILLFSVGLDSTNDNEQKNN